MTGQVAEDGTSRLPPEIDGTSVDLTGVPDDAELIENDDGSVTVVYSDEEEHERMPFYANLAEDDSNELDPYERDAMGQELLELIERDIEDRAKRDEQYEEGLRRTGLGNDAPGGASFPGASRVVHPILAECAIDYSSKILRELFPPDGPVKTKIPGKVTAAKLDKAERKAKHMNWQLTEQIPEYRGELEQVQTQIPIGGAAYIHWWYDKKMKRPACEAIYIDDMILPFAAASFYSARRRTIRRTLTQQEFDSRVLSGLYRDIDASAPPAVPEQTKTASANDKIEGKRAISDNIDGLRIVYESYVFWQVTDDDEEVSPYIFHINEEDGAVLGIYRNWEEDDESRTELEWDVEHAFIPWRGAYPLGLPNLIGTMSGAMTGSLRALLDTAHINNSATMLKLKGAREGGQTKQVAVTEITEIEAPTETDDIRKIAMPMPFNQPSPVLFQLLGFLDGAARGVVRTALDDSAMDTSTNVPVGTQMSRVEQGMSVYSAIHSRQHVAQAKTLAILSRLNRWHLKDKETYDALGEMIVYQRDYEGPCDVVPVSDPNIFSEQQRFSQVQAVAARAQLLPQLYKLPEVEKRIMKMLKVPGGEELLVETFDAKDQDAVTENVWMALKRPVKAYDHQDHQAHIITHLAFLSDPNFGGSPLIAPTIVQGAIEHLKEHIVLWYQDHMHQLAARAVGIPMDRILQDKSDEARTKFDALMSTVSAIIHNPKFVQPPRYIQAIPQALMGLLQSAQAGVAAMAPLMQMMAPQDPAGASQRAETERKAKADAAVAEAKRGELALKGQSLQLQAQKDAAAAQERAQAQQLAAQTKGKELELKGIDIQVKAIDLEEKRKLAAEAQTTATALENQRLEIEQLIAAGNQHIAEINAQIADSKRADEAQAAADKIASEEKLSREDGEVALTIAEMEIESGEKTAFKNGNSLK